MPPVLSISQTAALVALIGAAALPLANYLVNHVVDSRRRAILQPLAVVVLAGTVVPALAIRWLMQNGWHSGDLPVDGADAPLLGISLVVGLALIALALRGSLKTEFPRVIRLLLALFPVSLAEVLVFLSILFNWIERIAASMVSSPWASVAAAIASAALFGLYHFTHSPPWNNWAQAALLFIVWLFVCLAYVLTRDAWAASIIDASFATIGFVRNRVTTLDSVPISRAVALDALSVGIVAAILGLT
ncbi:MAG: CPBP family glutamic-type intramembrane protease [Xanthobacteraceae bacterium]|jgi:membrane protease YdiL (CAAX protease family)